MIINTHNGSFIIQFQYDTEASSATNFANANGNPITRCFIRKKENGKRVEEIEVLGQGEAICDSRDIFTKAKGRKVALKKAMADAAKKIPEFGDFKLRTEIWHGYFAELNRPIDEEALASKKAQQKEKKEKAPRPQKNKPTDTLNTLVSQLSPFAKGTAKYEYYDLFMRKYIERMATGQATVNPIEAISVINKAVDKMFETNLTE